MDVPSLAATLKATLRTAANAVAAGRKSVACATLTVYVSLVRAAPARALTTAEKSELVADATRIRAVIGC